MKKMKLLYFVAATGILVAIGCNTASSGNPAAVGDRPKNPVHHVLCRLDSAVTDINYFNSLCQSRLGGSTPPIRAYTIRAIDLIGALGMDTTLEDSAKYKHIRMYLAYRQNAGFKLYLVPVDSAYIGGTDTANWRGGYDIFLNSEGKCIPHNKQGTRNTASADYVLDLNAPCPATCAENSPLTQ
jgi:hypothetical protein